MHENEIAHRDIKPSNIFFKDYSQMKIYDLNIAKYLEMSEVIGINSNFTEANPY